MHKEIAFFDFDGTITTKDTMLELARFHSGSLSYFVGICRIAPWLLAMKLKLLSKQQAKEKLLTHFFGGLSTTTFNERCSEFTNKQLPQLIKKEAIQVIQQHLKNKIPVVIVSASAENWVAPWCKQNNLQFICTRLAENDQKITGELQGKNCNGIEKVSRIKELFNLADFDIIYGYGDTKGDKMMLALATHPHYRFFKK